MAVVVKGFAGIQQWFDHVGAIRSAIPFDIDGAVAKVDELQLQQKLGWNSRTPRFAMAYKFPPQEALAVVHSIVCQVGRSGKLPPVAKIDPVFVGDVTVSIVTLHNQEQVHLKDVHIGDTVVVRRAGDMIPEIMRSVMELHPVGAEKFVMPPLPCLRRSRCEGRRWRRLALFGWPVMRCTAPFPDDRFHLAAGHEYQRTG